MKKSLEQQLYDLEERLSYDDLEQDDQDHLEEQITELEDQIDELKQNNS